MVLIFVAADLFTKPRNFAPCEIFPLYGIHIASVLIKGAVLTSWIVLYASLYVQYIARIFRQFCHLLLLAKILSVNFLSNVNYIEDMTSFTTLVKIYSTEYLNLAGLCKIFIQ